MADLGRDQLVEFLSTQRDAYAFIHDQTLRMLNQGLVGNEIAEQIVMPPALKRAWHTHSYDGSVSHNVKAIYQRYMGWFDGNPAHLWEHPPVEATRRYVEFMGGSEAVVARARQSFDAGDLRWVVTALNHVLLADPDHRAATQLQAEAFTQLGYGCENGMAELLPLRSRGPAGRKVRHPDRDRLAGRPQRADDRPGLRRPGDPSRRTSVLETIDSPSTGSSTGNDTG